MSAKGAEGPLTCSRWPPRRGWATKDPSPRQGRPGRVRGRRPGLPLPTEEGLGLETAAPPQASAAARLRLTSPANLPGRESVSPWVSGGLTGRGRRLPTASSPASPAGGRCPPHLRAAAVTRVTAARPGLAAGPTRRGGPGAPPSRGPGGGAQGREPAPPCAPNAPAPPSAAVGQ